MYFVVSECFFSAEAYSIILLKRDMSIKCPQPLKCGINSRNDRKVFRGIRNNASLIKNFSVHTIQIPISHLQELLIFMKFCLYPYV